MREILYKYPNKYHNKNVKKELPKIIKDVGFDFHWDNEKVWALDLPVEEIPIDDLVWHFEIPFWWENDGFYNLAPKTVLDNKDKYEERIKRIWIRIYPTLWT